MGLRLTTDLNAGQRVPLLLADGGDGLDTLYLSGALTLGDGDTEVCETEEYPTIRLVVGRLSHPGGRQRNLIAGLLLHKYLPAAANRWWLDLRGGVVITGMCHCGAPSDLSHHIYGLGARVSDNYPRRRSLDQENPTRRRPDDQPGGDHHARGCTRGWLPRIGHCVSRGTRCTALGGMS
ncbi:hypothetical protein AB0O28_36710 [Microbispora sp. NPDC088329]|uniref:hypothetical protein n=1 Tax=Microbispora sp. NPDC088329 TaxID=3154869 RepID=UPI003445E0D2